MPKKPLDNLTESMFYILMAFNNGPLCGIDIASFIQNKTQGRVIIGPATLYTILAKFEEERYIIETAVQGRKRTYKITTKGRNAYEAEIDRLKQCLKDAMEE